MDLTTRTMVLTGLVAALVAGGSSSAQTTTCKTGNCVVGKDGLGNPNLPPECSNIASPRVITVDMSSATLRFVPQDLRIEGESATAGVAWDYQCIRWHKIGNTAVPWHSATEDTSSGGGAPGCGTASACSSTNTTPPCDWETGNIDNAAISGNLEWSVCHYRDVPPNAAAETYHYRCRLHGGIGMVGTLAVVQPVALEVGKNLAGEAILEWNSGGIGPWNVFRDTAPAFPTAVNLVPAGTVARALTDAAPPATAFYLVMERN